MRGNTRKWCVESATIKTVNVPGTFWATLHNYLRLFTTCTNSECMTRILLSLDCVGFSTIDAVCVNECIV